MGPPPMLPLSFPASFDVTSPFAAPRLLVPPGLAAHVCLTSPLLDDCTQTSSAPFAASDIDVPFLPAPTLRGGGGASFARELSSKADQPTSGTRVDQRFTAPSRPAASSNDSSPPSSSSSSSSSSSRSSSSSSSLSSSSSSSSPSRRPSAHSRQLSTDSDTSSSSLAGANSAVASLNAYGIPILRSDSSVQAWRCAYPHCSSRASFTRGCDLRKHYNRHSKHLYCRFPRCPRSQRVAAAIAEGCDGPLNVGFSSEKDLERHEAQHNPSIECEYLDCNGNKCGRVFSRVDNMKDHVKRIHKARRRMIRK